MPKQAYRKRRPCDKRAQPAAELPREVQLLLDPAELTRILQEEVRNFATEVGLKVALQLLEHEVTERCGAKHERSGPRELYRHGHQSGSITIAGQKLPVSKPRMRKADGSGEVELARYADLQNPAAMPEACLRRMVRGVSTRDYEAVIDRGLAGFGVQRSSVSRGFVKASAKEIAVLAERKLDHDRFVAIFIDGKEFAGEMMIVALGITAKGQKQVLGLRQGGTENAEVVTSLLANLVERGLDSSRPTLFVLDGAKALSAAVKRVFGKHALIQRCQVHKLRNVQAHLPEKHHAQLVTQLSAAYHETSYGAALGQLQTTLKWVERLSPNAAASLREGLEETLTVVKLGLPELLRRTLATTNPIESALSVVGKVTGRVKRWRDGDMRLRWCTAGLLRAEQKFNRVRGHKQLHLLVSQLDVLDTKTIDAEQKSA